MQNFQVLGAPRPDTQNSPPLRISGYAPEFCQIALSVEDCRHWSHTNDYRELLELTIAFRGKWFGFQYVVDNVLAFYNMSSVICTA